MPQYYPKQAFALTVVAGYPFLAAIFVGLRVNGRWRSRVQLSWDDYLIVLANILSIALAVPSVMNVYMWNYGIHLRDVPSWRQIPDMTYYYHTLLAYNALHTPILPLVKCSIIVLLLRIGSVVTLYRRILIGIMVFNLLSCIGPWVALLFMCPPKENDQLYPTVFPREGGLKCLGNFQSGIVFVYIVTSNLLTDLLIFPIPFLMIYRLQHAKLRLKLIAIGSFALSICATALGVYRLKASWAYQLFRIDEDKSDWTYKITYCLNHAENNTAIIVACIPTLRSLVLSWMTGDKSQAALRKTDMEVGNATFWMQRGQDERKLDLRSDSDETRSLKTGPEASTAGLTTKGLEVGQEEVELKSPATSMASKSLRTVRSADHVDYEVYGRY